KLIEKENRKRDKQETIVSAAKGDLEEKREVLSAINLTLKELHDELATLAVGKNSERLPFGEAKKSEDKPLGDKPISNTQDAWRGVALSSLAPAIKQSKLKVLAENTPSITTLGELADWQAKKGEFWAKDLRGLGDGGREQIEKACEAYYAANPIQAAKPTDAPFDDSTIKDDTADGIIKLPGICFLDVAQRAGGKWATRYAVSIGKISLDVAGRQPEWVGDHASKTHAIAAGLDVIFDFVKGLQRQGGTGKPKKQAAQVVAAIDAVDKKINADLKADGIPDDIKQCWADRPAREVDEVPAKGKAKKAGKK